MADKKRDDNKQSAGHDSTTIPGGEKELGNPGRTSGTAQSDRRTVEEGLRRKEK